MRNMVVNRERFDEILREERVYERVVRDWVWETIQREAPDMSERGLREVAERMRERIICMLVQWYLNKKARARGL